MQYLRSDLKTALEAETFTNISRVEDYYSTENALDNIDVVPFADGALVLGDSNDETESFTVTKFREFTVLELLYFYKRNKASRESGVDSTIAEIKKFLYRNYLSRNQIIKLEITNTAPPVELTNELSYISLEISVVGIFETE